MIKVTRLNGKEFVVNTDLIKTIEATPDTIIRLVSEDKFLVREGVDEIIGRIVEYRRSCQMEIGVNHALGKNENSPQGNNVRHEEETP